MDNNLTWHDQRPSHPQRPPTVIATWHDHEVIVIETWNNPVVDVEFATVQTQDGTRPFKCYSSHSHENPGMQPAFTDIGIVVKDDLEDVHEIQESEPIDLERSEINV